MPHRPGTDRDMTTNTTRVTRWAGVDQWSLAATALRVATRTYLWGPRGCGKSVLTAMDPRPTYRIAFSEDLTFHDLAGHYVPQGDHFEFRYGPVALAMKEGARLVCDELHLASGPVRDFLRGVLDRGDIGGIALPNGERLAAAEGFTVVATSNAPPSILDAPLRSRFEAEVELSVPNPELVAALNRDFDGLGDALADSFRDPTRSIDPRKLLAMSRFIRSGVATRTAALLCFGASAPDLVSALNARGVVLP